MATKKTPKPEKMEADNNHPFKLGEIVEIRYSNGQRGRIVELRGALGPKGANVYRIRLRRRPKPTYVELPEDQLLPIPVEA